MWSRLAAGFMALSLLAASGCGGAASKAAGKAHAAANSTSSPAKAGRSQSPLPIVIGYQPDPDAPFFVAKQEGLFAKAGLAPKFIEFNAGPPMFAALKRGSIDVAGEGFGAYVTGVVRGIPQVAFSIQDRSAGSAGLVARNGSGIRSVSDLKGKIVATVTGSGEYFALLQALAQKHLSVKSVDYRNLQPPAMLAAFKNGEIDAAWVWPPWDYDMAGFGGKIVLRDSQLGILEPPVWVANSGWAAGHKQTLTRFLHANELGLAVMKAHPMQAAKDTAGPIHVTPQVALAIMHHTQYPDVKQQISPTYSLSFTHGYQRCDAGFAAAVGRWIAIARKAGIYKTAPASCHSEFTPAFMKAYAGG